MSLHGYGDSGWAGDKQTYRSTTGTLFFLAGGVISASSKRHSCVAQSTVEAEYYAIGQAAMKASWLSRFLTELGYEYAQCVELNGDNQGALALTENP